MFPASPLQQPMVHLKTIKRILLFCFFPLKSEDNYPQKLLKSLFISVHIFYICPHYYRALLSGFKTLLKHPALPKGITCSRMDKLQPCAMVWLHLLATQQRLTIHLPVASRGAMLYRIVFIL